MGALLLLLRKMPRTQAPGALFGLGLVLLAEIALLARIVDTGPVVMTMGRWLPPFGITFVADALGVTLALTATLVAMVCALYGIRDIDASERRYGFYSFLMLLMTGVAGSFLTGDIFNLYVWFEIFVLSSFGLIVLGSRARQLDGAVKYAVLNLVGTTLFLIATGLLYGVFGTLNMADIAMKAQTAPADAPLMTLATLYLAAFGMKAAAFPLNAWLPASYHTPRIVVSALFAAILTKIGIYSLLRTLVMIFPVQGAELSSVIAWVAALTMMLGVIGALAQSDIRRIFGFIVVSGIGVMMAGIALGSQTGVAGTIVYAVHSMLAMAALYILAGTMRRIAGSSDLAKLSGLYASHPLLAGMALILILSVAGLPPGSGLWPKVYLVKASLDGGSWWLALAILASGLLTTLALGRIFTLAFWRPQIEAREVGAEAVADARLGHLALGILLVPMLALGLWPEPFLQIADLAAAGLLEPAGYLGGVFPGEGAP
jgi:multicomponent Na+:H+ antiporter subunit D